MLAVPQGRLPATTTSSASQNIQGTTVEAAECEVAAVDTAVQIKSSAGKGVLVPGTHEVTTAGDGRRAGAGKAVSASGGIPLKMRSRLCTAAMSERYCHLKMTMQAVQEGDTIQGGIQQPQQQVCLDGTLFVDEGCRQMFGGIGKKGRHGCCLCVASGPDWKPKGPAGSLSFKRFAHPAL